MLDIDFSEVNKIKFDKYRRISGILAIDKPVGITSHDVVDIVRKKLKTKKVGHAGALDPFATGLLLIMVGKYTKKAELLIKQDKSYTCRIIFGIETDSHDIDGKVLEIDREFVLNENLLKEKIKILNKEYFQYVPVFSSVKYNGIKLRELARNSENFEVYNLKNKKFVRGTLNDSTPKKIAKRLEDKSFDFELPGKSVSVSIDIISTGKYIPDFPENIEIKSTKEFHFADLQVDCSKGTYIRQIASDLGEMLNTKGILMTLRRTRIAEVTADQSISPDELESL